jgi:hypothetical protein
VKLHGEALIQNLLHERMPLVFAVGARERVICGDCIGVHLGFDIEVL